MKSRVAVSSAVFVLLLPPVVVGAQGPTRAAPRTNNTGGNMCLQLDAGPSRLSSSPEGQVFTRMKAELEAVERALRADTTVRRQYLIVQGRLDSVGRMITGTDGPGNRLYFESHPNAAVMVDGQRVDPSDPMRMMVSSKLRELQPQLAELSRSNAPTVIGTLNIRLNTLGYVGLTATAGTFPMTVDYMQPFAYCDYPRVESVEVGSPAFAAGLIAGDTLIAYNGRDLRQTNVNYPELMIPGNKLSIRYRRDGRFRTANLVVAAREPQPSHLIAMGACTDAELANACRTERVIVRASGGVGTGSVPAAGSMTSGNVSPQGTLSRLPAAPARVSGGSVMAAAPRNGILMFDNMGGIRFAGAVIQAYDVKTAENMGTEAGLYVFQSPVGSLSFQQGLRSGDWIVSVNGSEARDVAAFRKAFEIKAADHTMTLQVSSKTEGARTVSISW